MISTEYIRYYLDGLSLIKIFLIGAAVFEPAVAFMVLVCGISCQITAKMMAKCHHQQSPKIPTFSGFFFCFFFYHFILISEIFLISDFFLFN